MGARIPGQRRADVLADVRAAEKSTLDALGLSAEDVEDAWAAR